MIVTFQHKGLEELFLTGKSRRIGPAYARRCLRILQMLDDATKPEEVNFAGSRFHPLHGLPRRWSLCVTGNYRITFGWSGENAAEIDYEDYH